ncbi:MAG: sigma-70 family RNA polymerase sigma factor [Firmicutes bacterium]|nr:sigma-70 family RNA polymerase sigma factor [Bacillota bacterium]
MDPVRQLVARSQQNDLQAFEDLITRYQDRVFTLCRQLTGNHTDAQDLSQEVFVKAYFNLASFRFEADFGTWLHRIAVNQWLNFKRKKGILASVSLDEPIHTDQGEMAREVASDTMTPEEAYEKEETRRLVHQAMQKISPEHRMVLVLREFNEMSYEDLAAVLDCSLGTVKSRLNRARQSLKEEIEKLNRVK